VLLNSKLLKKTKSVIVVLKSSVDSPLEWAIVNAIRNKGAKVMGIDSDPS